MLRRRSARLVLPQRLPAIRTQPAQGFQVQPQQHRMVDRGLLEVVEIGSVVHMAERIDLVEADADKPRAR